MLGHANKTLVALVDLLFAVGLLLAEDGLGGGFRVVLTFCLYGDNFSMLIFYIVDGIRMVFDFDKHETWHIL